MKEKSSLLSRLTDTLRGATGVVKQATALVVAIGALGSTLVVVLKNHATSDDRSESAPASSASHRTPGPERATMAASVDLLQDGDGVCYQQKLRGTAVRVPESTDLWLVVYAPARRRFYPAERAKKVDSQSHTSWYGDAFFGRPNGDPTGDDVGADYEFQIVSADETASRLLAELSPAARQRGLRALPNGTKPLKRVGVTRSTC